ncbi:hypothetical protein ACFV08_22640, partial [Streptomyces fradiae]|uniref:hypothetical protein n=1 Tax=Streptomyces fradiae TaxID=1906 RepID=UPI0036B26309
RARRPAPCSTSGRDREIFLGLVGWVLCITPRPPPLRDPVVYGRTPDHPLPEPVLGHADYQADPAFARERAALLDRLPPALPLPVPRQRSDGPDDTA